LAKLGFELALHAQKLAGLPTEPQRLISAAVKIFLITLKANKSRPHRPHETLLCQVKKTCEPQNQARMLVLVKHNIDIRKLRYYRLY